MSDNIINSISNKEKAKTISDKLADQLNVLEQIQEDSD